MLSRNSTSTTLVVLFATTSAMLSLHAQESRPANSPAAFADWPRYGGTPENNHYSALAQINRETVGALKVVWQFDTGEEGGLQTSPIIVNGHRLRAPVLASVAPST